MRHATKLTDTVQKRLVDAFRRGATQRLAALYAGINERTLYVWMTEGRGAGTGEFRDLFDAIEKAQAEARIKYLTIIDASMGCSPGCELNHEHTPLDWKAAAWKLERLNPEEWGRGPRQMDVNLNIPTDRVAINARIAELLAKRDPKGKAKRAAVRVALTTPEARQAVLAALEAAGLTEDDLREVLAT